MLDTFFNLNAMKAATFSFVSAVEVNLTFVSDLTMGGQECFGKVTRT